LKELKPEHLRTVLELTLKNSAEFRWRLLQVAKRFGAIRRDADISAVPIGKLVESFAGTPVFEETHREMLTEKLDLGGTRDALRKLKQMKIHTVFRGEPSVFACYLLNQLLGGEIVMPRRAEREILQAVRHRLENRTVILFCLNCTEWKRVTRVKRIAGDPKCARCGAKLVTLVPEKNEKLIGLLKKHRQGAKLTKEELAEVARAERIASLVLTYGRKALLALSGRGVGWKTATRILAKSYRSEDDFYREILRAERTYAKTRRFWER
jgi:ATP-dependent Lhr-like helicase